MTDVARGYIGRGVLMRRRSASFEAGRSFTVTVATGASVPNNSIDTAQDVTAGLAKTSRAFACPGLFRIVAARDGGICRIKLARGRLTSAQARDIATIAARFATGAIEVTNRANLQIRGITPGTETEVIAALRAADLGAANAGADDIRNVMVSPLAGEDPEQMADVSGLADQILQRLQDAPRYHALSPKFGIQIDGGEAVAMLNHPNDIWLSAVDQECYAFGFAGCPPQDDQDQAIGFVAATQASDLVFACLELFLRFNGRRNGAGHEITRLRHLLADMSASEILAQIAFPVSTPGEVRTWRRRPVSAFAPLGILSQRDGNAAAIGAMPPLGRLAPETLTHLADLADRFTGSEIRCTPWQSVLLPHVARADSNTLLSAIDRLGLLVRSDKPLARFITCAGNAGCASGHTDTKSDAAKLANRLEELGTAMFHIHVTGCSKSCAAPRPAQATLVGISPGQYDVFWRDPSAATKFGALIGANQSVEEASRLLARRHSEQR
jgi:precorrin-3B synthase